MFDASNIQHSSQLAQQQRINALNPTNLAGMWCCSVTCHVRHAHLRKNEGVQTKWTRISYFLGRGVEPSFSNSPSCLRRRSLILLCRNSMFLWSVSSSYTLYALGSLTIFDWERGRDNRRRLPTLPFLFTIPRNGVGSTFSPLHETSVLSGMFSCSSSLSTEEKSAIKRALSATL